MARTGPRGRPPTSIRAVGAGGGPRCPLRRQLVGRDRRLGRLGHRTGEIGQLAPVRLDAGDVGARSGARPRDRRRQTGDVPARIRSRRGDRRSGPRRNLTSGSAGSTVDAGRAEFCHDGASAELSPPVTGRSPRPGSFGELTTSLTLRLAGWRPATRPRLRSRPAPRRCGQWLSVCRPRPGSSSERPWSGVRPCGPVVPRCGSLRRPR